MSTNKTTRNSVKPSNVAAGPKMLDTSTAAKRKVLLVDDHPMTREGMAAILNSQSDLQVCCQAGSPSEAMSVLANCAPDLMVTDMTMPGRSGIEFLKDIHAMLPELPILVLSMHDELLYAERALRAGARGYLMKDAGALKLLEVIRLILAGQSFVSSRITARMLDSMSGRRPRGSASPIETLSDREFEVFNLIGSGLSTRDIAAQLHLSPKTVDVHRSHLKEKLSLKDATALVRYAVRWVETQNSVSI